MKYLLDTCVISELVKPKPSRKIVQWIQGCDEDGLFLSVLTLGEIQKGIAKLADGKRKATIQQWLDHDLRRRFAGRVIGITAEVAATWGLIAAETESRGAPVPSINGLIAATAMAHNLIVVTRNTDDMSRTGVRLFNPWDL